MYRSADEGNDNVEPHTVWVAVETDKDCARALGKWNRNRTRIENALQCSILKSEDNRYLEIRGSYENAMTAATIIRCSIAHHGRGDLSMKQEDVLNNCTTMHIPREATKMVLGSRGAHLQQLEDQCRTIMFLAAIVDLEVQHDTSTLVIFGGRCGRRLAQFLVMGLVEKIFNGTFSKPWYDNKQTFDAELDLDGDWGTTVLDLPIQADRAWVLGKDHEMLRKLMKTSGCVLGVVGNLLYVSGTEEQRTYAGEYLDWVFESRDHEKGYVQIRRPEERTDCKLVWIPNDLLGHIVGASRQMLSRVEDDFGVMIFGLLENPSPDEQAFAILGPERSRFGAQLRLQELVERERPGFMSDIISEGKSDESGFAVDYLRLGSGDDARVYGKEGWMQRNLSAASNADIRVIGNVCCVAGDINERDRAHSYIEWLLHDFDEEAKTLEASHREDVTDIRLSELQWRHITRAALRNISQRTDTFLFFTRTPEGEHGVRVCGHNAGEEYEDKGRTKAEMLVRWECEGHALRTDKRASNDELLRPWKAPRISQDHNVNVDSSWSKVKEERNRTHVACNTKTEEITRPVAQVDDGSGKIIPKSHQKLIPKVTRNSATQVIGNGAQADSTIDKLPKTAGAYPAIPKSQSDGRWSVFVAGLPAECTSGKLRLVCLQMLSEAGLVSDSLLDCSVKLGRGSGRLEFASQASGEIAIHELHQREVPGWDKPLRARWTVEACQHML